MSDRRCARPVPNHAAAAVHAITPPEVKLIVELADGRTVSQIARHHRVADGTVSRWLAAVRNRVGAQTSAQLVAWAYQRRVLVVSRD